jgi:4-hydroxy-tetrahydrodipicolinate synthase
MPLHRSLFCETNPAPAKYALSRLGRCTPEVRLPMLELSERAMQEVDAALAAVGLPG